MRKLLKRLGIITIILLVIFIAWCFLSDDEYDSDEEVYTSSSLSDGNALSISDIHSESKKELINNGLVREQQVQPKGNGEDTVTILLYMNGSNLESDDQAATTDLTEMINAGSSDKVNLIVQTMGTKKWSKKYGIASDRSQRYSINSDGLTLLQDDLGQLDCNSSQTLEDFVKWGAANYPADRYILLFWNHGGGPIYGFGYDEWNSDESACLSVDEMQKGLKEAGVYFDFIGMDCCIMSCMEVGCALYDYCDYLVLSEDFESGMGWEYTNWLKALYSNTSISTPQIGQIICDEMVNANLSDSRNGDESIMALIDVSMMKVLYTAWKDFAFANEKSLLNTNYSERVTKKAGGRLLPSIERHNINKRAFDDDDYSFFDVFWFGDSEEYKMSDYYVTDIMAVAQNIESEESKALASAVGESLLYVRTTSGDSSLTGISVTLPYGDKTFYSDMKKVFTNIGFDNDYITWLQKFTSVSNNVNSYDYSDWSDSWDGWDEYEDDYDWSDWEHYDDESEWEDEFGFDDFSFGDSFNSWFFDNYDEYDDGCYEGDDFYYDDCYYEDDFYWFLW